MAAYKQVAPGRMASLGKTGRQVSRSLRQQAVVLGGTFALFWTVFAVNNLLGGMLNVFGVIPRTTIGLRGLIFAPFIHQRFDHIVANSLPFLALGWMVMLRDPRHFVPVTLMSAIGSASARGPEMWSDMKRQSAASSSSGCSAGCWSASAASGWSSTRWNAAFTRCALRISFTVPP